MFQWKSLEEVVKNNLNQTTKNVLEIDHLLMTCNHRGCSELCYKNLLVSPFLLTPELFQENIFAVKEIQCSTNRLCSEQVISFYKYFNTQICDEVAHY